MADSVIEKALCEDRGQKFFEAVNQAFADLKKLQTCWQEEMAERQAWDITLADDLESE